MKKPIITAAVLYLLLFLGVNISFAQPSASDTTSKSPAEDYVINYFNKSIGEQSGLFNGTEYIAYSPLIKSNPYFSDTADWRTGKVNFNGYTYNNVPLMYDLYKDLLVVLLYNKFTKYTLNSTKVNSFDLMGHHFKYVSADTVTNSPGSGYYEQLYGGRVQALVRYTKTIQNTSSGTTDIETYFTNAKKEFFVQRKGSYYAVGSEGSVLNVLKDHKKELQQYIKSNKIRFRQQPEQALVMITTYYDHLTN